LTIIFGAIIYYIDAFYYYDIIIVLILIIGSFIFLGPKIIKSNQGHEGTKINWLIIDKKNYKYFIAYGLVYVFAITSLYSSSSDQPLISPWQVVKTTFFISYALASLILILASASSKLKTNAKLFLISLHYFLSLLIAVIIYKIGYGFDPFIHQATMELIDKKGLVTPKLPYYLGQYSLIIIFHKISGLSIYFLNKILLPCLTAFFLPVATFRYLKSFFINPSDTDANNNDSSRFLALIFLLILSVSPFIVTTPQNLSYLFLILTILNGLKEKNISWTILLALATAAIHPLTGLPVLGWVAWLIFQKYQTTFGRTKAKIIKIILFSSNALILPISLFIAGGANFKIISLNPFLLLEPFKKIFSGLSLAGNEDWLFNFIYFFNNNFNLFLILLIVISLIYFYRQKTKPNWSSLFYINISLLFAYIISSQIIFNDLINYEQSSYASRLLIIICFFNLPFIIWLIEKLISKILEQELVTKLLWLLLGVSMISTSLYISYPRYDKYYNSRGYSVGVNDLKAVSFIDQNTKEKYIVLANQQVSVAALKQFGFNNYYQTSKGLLYFYPIPTGGPLYQYYLDMVYIKPDQKTAQAAMNLTKTKEVYLIINKYWNNSGKIINEAKINANDWFNINNEVYIFKYEAKN
jgi:hypothetical protein